VGLLLLLPTFKSPTQYAPDTPEPTIQTSSRHPATGTDLALQADISSKLAPALPKTLSY